MLWGPVTVVDDRGKRVPLMRNDLRSRRAMDTKQRTRLDHAAREQLEVALTRTELMRMAGFLVLVLSVPLMVSVVPPRLRSITRLPWWAAFTICFCVAIAMILALFRLAHRVAPGRIMRTYIRAGFCASCGYDLEGAVIEEDGCRRCSECGAAWRAENA